MSGEIQIANDNNDDDHLPHPVGTSLSVSNDSIPYINLREFIRTKPNQRPAKSKSESENINNNNEQEEEDETNDGNDIHSINGNERRRHMGADVYKAAVDGTRDGIQRFIGNDGRNARLLPVTPEGRSVLHIHVGAPFQARPAKVNFIRYIIDLDDSLLSLKDNDQGTPLHQASTFGQHEAVQTFLERQDLVLDVLLHTNKEGDTALHMALRNKQVKVVGLLAPLALLNEYSKNDAGESILYLAAETGSSHILDTILRHMSRPLTSHFGFQSREMALHGAVMGGDPGMVRSILVAFPDLIKIEDGKKQTPVHYAAEDVDKHGILKLLLEQPECSSAAHIQDEEGRTAAHIAAQYNNVYALELLINQVPDSCEIVDKQGRNVVHYAASRGHGEALEYMLMDSRFSHLVYKKDSHGYTPFHCLAESFKGVSPHSLARVRYNLFPMLRRLQLKVFNNDGFTPGDIARSFKPAELEPSSWNLVEEFKKVAPQGGPMQKKMLETLEEQKRYSEAEKRELDDKIKKMAKTHSIVTTIIFSVSFTAGLSVPGGFNQNVGNDGGTAMLRKQRAFQVFLISDWVALTFSTMATLIYFLIILLKGKRSLRALFKWGFAATCIALVALTLAFMGGTCSIVGKSHSLVFIMVLISSVLFFLYALFVMATLAILKARSNLMGRDPERFKRRSMHRGQVN